MESLDDKLNFWVDRFENCGLDNFKNYQESLRNFKKLEEQDDSKENSQFLQNTLTEIEESFNTVETIKYTIFQEVRKYQDLLLYFAVLKKDLPKIKEIVSSKHFIKFNFKFDEKFNEKFDEIIQKIVSEKDIESIKLFIEKGTDKEILKKYATDKEIKGCIGRTKQINNIHQYYEIKII